MQENARSGSASWMIEFLALNAPPKLWPKSTYVKRADDEFAFTRQSVTVEAGME